MADKIDANASTAEVDALRELAGRFDKLILEDTPIELYEANLAFHYRPLSPCGNSELVKLVTDIRQRTSSAPVSQWKTRARIEQSSREHHEMVNTIPAGKTAALKDGFHAISPTLIVNDSPPRPLTESSSDRNRRRRTKGPAVTRFQAIHYAILSAQKVNITATRRAGLVGARFRPPLRRRPRLSL